MSQDQRRPLVGGNWKMHKIREEASQYCRAFAPAVAEASAQVVLFPSHPLLATVAEALAGSGVETGGQDLHPATHGAHTGDVAAAQLLDAGCRWVLCGHSERRHDHGEADGLVAKKVEAATAAGLVPMLCVGETEDERASSRTLDVLAAQLEAGLASRPEVFALAYEPVWAIGTGQTATPEIAQEAHRFLRNSLADLVGDHLASSKRILYGGSVNPDNAAELFDQPDIDGFLVGGASLDPERFSAIIRCCDS